MNHTSFLCGSQTLPPHILAIIGSVPRAGTGVHRWLFVSARKLYGHFPSDEIVGILRFAVKGCERYVPDSEIVNAVRNAARIKGGQCQPGDLRSGLQAWPKSDPDKIRRVVSSIEHPLERLANGTSWGGLPQVQTDFVPALVGILFPGDPLICAGSSVESMRCLRLSEWGASLSATQLIVPSPMTARRGVNQEGRSSSRCLGNTGPRRFLVVEFDALPVEAQAAIHIHLAARYPLALVVHSGGKSLHGWFHVANQAEERVRDFMRYAVSMGADPHTWTRCQAVRTPGGLRRDGGQMRIQEVVFFNPCYAA
ncbi:MAG TPA: hypothetical protein PLA50_00125 [Bacteroidia bacterium]|nr:hypothetical protein [Bacteroidia bacterium]